MNFSRGNVRQSSCTEVCFGFFFKQTFDYFFTLLFLVNSIVFLPYSGPLVNQLAFDQSIYHPRLDFGGLHRSVFAVGENPVPPAIQMKTCGQTGTFTGP